METIDSNLYNNQYVSWLYEIAMPEPIRNTDSYLMLFNTLHRHRYDYSDRILLDRNRLSDGINLRNRYVDYLKNDEYAHLDIETPFQEESCSVLEMMVALAIRCEESLMHDPEKGNRIPIWFWDMIVNLELDDMSDYNFDEGYVEAVIDRLINREYSPNGKGGLFYIPDCRKDLRYEELWTQLCWYMGERMD